MDQVWLQTRAALERAWAEIVSLGVSALQAAVVAIIAIFVADLLRAHVKRAATRLRLAPNLVALAGTSAVIATYVVAASIILALLGGSWTAIVAAFSAGAVALTLALQDVLRAFIAGVYLLVERPFEIGDRIRIGDAEGEVRSIEFRTTELVTDAGDLVLIPNSTVFAAIVTNRGRRDAVTTTVRVDNVAAGPDVVDGLLAHIRATLQDALVGTPKVSLRAASAEGLAFDLTVPLRPGSDPSPLIALLHERFPGATVALASQ